MTIIEMFRTKSVEEIADEFVKEYRRSDIHATSPYHINKYEAMKKHFIEWLNSEVPDGHI